MVIIFVATLFNTALIIVIKNADFREFGVQVLKEIFSTGKCNDFNK